jgi:circadian clock protein KaiC
MTPGEFASKVSQAVQEDGARLIVIDGLNGYLQSMPDETFMSQHMQGLLSHLGQHGVITLTTLAQTTPRGASLALPMELSYLADTVISQRYFEAMGSIRYAISVLKRRYGDHERAVREYRIGPNGLELGEPLTKFRGVLLDSPVYLGSDPTLL